MVIVSTEPGGLIDLSLDKAYGNVWRINNRSHGRDGGDELVNVGGSETDEWAAHAEFREKVDVR
jgi:hypothetical protein